MKDVFIIQKTGIFKRHQILCDNYFDNEKAFPILPNDKDKILRFKNIHKTVRIPGHPRAGSEGGLPGELGSRDWCHWIQLTKHI